MLLSAIMALCYFIAPGSAERVDRDADSLERFGILGYKAVLWALYGFLIPETELTWSFLVAKLDLAVVRWIILIALALIFASVYDQFYLPLGRLMQKSHIAAVNWGFPVYQNLLAFYYVSRFRLSRISQGEHEYESLNEQASEIRLFKLLPLRLGSHIQGEFVITPLMSAPAFEAVSYRWKTGHTIPILLEGRKFLVFEAVYYMLQGLRLPEDNRLLWIDAICINQEDMDEKRWQVIIMCDIYKLAERVIGWLNYHPLTNGALSSLAVLGSFTAKFNGLSISATKTAISKTSLPPQLEELLENLYSSAWVAIYTLMANEWFSRLWVIQEVANARVILVQHGTEQVTWQNLMLAIQVVGMFAAKGTDVHMPQLRKIHLAGGNNVSNIMSTSTFRNKLGTSPLGLSMGYLMRETLSFDATTTSDRVFGLLGLSTAAARQKINVDYTLPENDVFLSVSRYILLEEQSLDYLQTAGNGFRFPKDSDSSAVEAPSWVPSRRYRNGVLPSIAKTGVHRFQTATHLKTAIESVGDNPSLIAVSGNFFDHISFVSPIFFHPDHMPNTAPGRSVDKTKLMLKAIEMIFDFARLGISAELYGNEIEQTIWVAIANKVDESDPTQLEIRDSMIASAKKALQTVIELIPIVELTASQATVQGKTVRVEDVVKLAQSENSLISSLMNTFDKRLCITARGYLGVVPPLSRKGDLVCVFAGGNVPCIVRQCSNIFARRTYELVGACYINGIMHGQLAKSKEAMEQIIIC